MGDAAAEHGAVIVGDVRIAYSVVRSARRRKTVAISLVRRGEVRVAAPVRTSLEQIEVIVMRRAAWIIRRGSVADPDPDRPGRSSRRFVTGESLTYLGRQVPLVVEESADPGVALRLHRSRFAATVSRAVPVGERAALFGVALERWYRRRAAERFAARIERFAPIFGVTPLRVLVRSQRRAWGSCSAAGVLHLNWRLIMAPPPLLDYVVVHELAHLRVRGHNATFWALVAGVVPDHRERRAQLRVFGPQLEL